VSGHAHRPALETRKDILFLNPGSAGPRRFTLPISVARIVVRGFDLYPELIPLLAPPREPRTAPPS